MTYTPGPWTFDGTMDIKDKDDALVMRLDDYFYPSQFQTARRKTDARLMAAAPELLEALQALGAKPDGYCFCVNQNQIQDGHTGECRDAQQAIKSARSA